MDNSIISDVRTKALKEGLADGMEIARKLLCNTLGKEAESLGIALAMVDLLIIENKRLKRAQTTFDE